jgi:hypothetical protein
MDPLTLALATFGIQKLRGKSTGRSFRDAFLMGGGAYGIGQMGGGGIGIGTGAPLSGAKAMWGTAGTAATKATVGAAGQTFPGAAAVKGTGIKGWWGGLTPGGKVGAGMAGSVLAGELMGEDEIKPPFTEEDYKKAYEKQSKLTSGMFQGASYSGTPSLYSNQNVYSYNTGGLASIQKFSEGGVSYMPSKIEHNEKDTNNYIRATGYVEDGTGVGDKDEDTILAQLADGEFVSRADAILGAGIMSGAAPGDPKDMRKKGAAFFYDQQKKFKRIFDLLHASKKTIN